MENRNNNHLNLNNNYWEAIFSSFAKINKLTSYFTEKLKPTNKESSLANLYYNFLNKDISVNNFIKEFQNIAISKNINNSSPPRIINFFLEELHNELKNKKIEVEEINNNNNDSSNDFIYDNNQAYKLYADYAKNNKSFIQELFFGTKKIIKYCQSCKSKSYEYNYLKLIPLNLQNITDSVDLEYLFGNIQREFEQKLFCPKCKKDREFKKKIEIKKKPEILIFILYNYKKNIKVDFVPTLEEDYQLKSLVIGYEKQGLLNSILSCAKNNNKGYVSYGQKNSKFFMIKNNKINYVKRKDFAKGNPHILFYKRKNENSKEDKKEKNIDSNHEINSKETMISSKKKKNSINFSNTESLSFDKISNDNDSDKNKVLSNRIKGAKNGIINIKEDETTNDTPIKKSNNKKKNENRINDINVKNKILNESLKTNDIITNNSIKNDNNKNNNLIYASMINSKFINGNTNTICNENGKIITLYFKFNNGNIFFIDVDDSNTFEKIKIELKKAYEWIVLDDVNLYFNQKKIENYEIPKNLGIDEGDYIDVY